MIGTLILTGTASRLLDNLTVIEGTAFLPEQQGRDAPMAEPQAAPAAPANSAPAASPAAPVPAAQWHVQVGAFGRAGAAEAHWAALRSQLPELGELNPSYQQNGSLTRVRIGPVADRAAAARLCAQLVARGHACYPVRP